MQDFLDLFGKGKFTCGAKYICFLPAGSDPLVGDPYVKIAQAPKGAEDQPEWILFAEAACELLNANHLK